MSVINSVLHILFPRRHSAEVIEQATPDEIRNIYAPQTEHGCVVLSPYRDPLIRAAVQETKFHNNEHAAILLAELLMTWTKTHVMGPTIVVPIPLAPARLRERGYNQVMRVVYHVATNQSNLSVNERILKRQKYTKPQTQLSKEERQQNLNGAFVVANDRAARTITDAHILLVDDVLTTGATIQAAQAALLPHRPASLTCLALAH